MRSISLKCSLISQAHFEDNPLDLEFLRHDKPLHPTRIQPHLKIVPKYLLPSNMAANDSISSAGRGEASTGFVPFKKSRPSGRGKGRQHGGRGGGKKKSDPLKKFKR